VAGTNGKGSVAHTIAAQLQVCGYRIGLYTSPHLLNFNERIRINGNPIPEEYVVGFVEAEKEYFNQVKPTFFEIATIMAFQYFSEMDVDIAVIEVGLGGRLDSTNIITPIVSVITNISLDHTHLLGTSVEQIAMEKGGIIKKGVPVIIGEATPETRPVFEALAAENEAPITFASDDNQIVSAEMLPNGHMMYTNAIGIKFEGELGGIYQTRNTNTSLFVIKELMDQGYLCSCEKEANLKRIQEEMNMAYANVCQLT
jgi:dihydrofolate synthase/folylpolyglutamate synthase